MPAPLPIETYREDVEARLGAYAIRPCERSGFKIIRRCRTGEMHIGFFKLREEAEDYLFDRLQQARA